MPLSKVAVRLYSNVASLAGVVLYDEIGVGYAVGRTDPVIAAQIWAALGTQQAF